MAAKGSATKQACEDDEEFFRDLKRPSVLYAYMRDAMKTLRSRRRSSSDLARLKSACQILDLDREPRAKAAVDAARQLAKHGRRRFSPVYPYLDVDYRAAEAAHWLLKSLLRTRPTFQDADLCELIKLGPRVNNQWWSMPVPSLVTAAERHVVASGGSASTRLRNVLRSLRRIRQFTEATAEYRKLRSRIDALIRVGGGKRARGGAIMLPLKDNEPWTRAVRVFVTSLKSEQQQSWLRLLEATKRASGSSPSAKWLKQARATIDVVGVESFKQRLCEWMQLASKGVIERNPFTGQGECEVGLDIDSADVLKGLIWAAASLDDPQLALPIADFAERCYTKLKFVGPRCAKAGNACVAALALMSGEEPAAQLSRLKQRVKQPSGRKMAEKALARFADRAGLAPEEVEEQSVPTYGLAADGTRRDVLGDFTAITRIAGSELDITWEGQSGKAQRTVPVAVKHDHAAALKELQTVHKQLKAALPAQRERLERLFLAERSWPLEPWRKCYIDHPLVGALARRLIWCIGEVPVVAKGSELRDVADRAVAVRPNDPVRLWHPAGRPVDEVLAWRQRLEALAITQPFKQAHREVYVLTDAERTTGTYSNRFAAHVLRQHQFHALATQRGWKYSLMGAFDSHSVPTIELPGRKLRVEFWVEAAATQETSPSGIFLYLTTDQVRFYEASESEPMPLERVPTLLFSELMRDVDLFVGVASVGNDPQWNDGGPDRRYADYWRDYSFGDLGETARTRRDVLQGLLPRLKIAARCSLNEKFLLVRGDRRTYKIHLGSANILMEPNDQYLCIVPDRSPGMPGNADLFLPFEGDHTLAVILSKAFLLAEDKKIKDPTITRQIDGR